jgi:hypothetical protein
MGRFALDDEDAGGSGGGDGTGAGGGASTASSASSMLRQSPSLGQAAVFPSSNTRHPRSALPAPVSTPSSGTGGTSAITTPSASPTTPTTRSASRTTVRSEAISKFCIIVVLRHF